jgi:hypothetical protein
MSIRLCSIIMIRNSAVLKESFLLPKQKVPMEHKQPQDKRIRV